MAKRSKRYRASSDKFDRQQKYGVTAAVAFIKEFPVGRADDTVEVAVNLGVNPKHADQIVRGAVVLPHGTGKVVRVAVFAKGDKEKEAKEAGADFVGGDDLSRRSRAAGSTSTSRSRRRT